MKKITNKLLGGVLLFSLSMSLTSCEGALDDILGEWSRPVPGESEPVSVSSITLNATSQALNVGDYFALTATVEPADADYEKIIWSSSDETIATVDETGIIHAIAAGEATITAQVGDVKATCGILVQDVYTAINQYKEATWDATNSKVVFTKKSVASVTEITDGYSGTIKEGWYSVTGNDVTINASYTLTGDVHLILCDDAKLTINGQIYGNLSYNLYIYGQANQTGQLVVDCSTADAISGITTLEVHGCQVKATTSSENNAGFYGMSTFNVYGGSVDAENTGTKGYGIWVADGSMNIYGGDVKAVGKGTGSCYGITGSSSTVTVYGGKLWAECAGGKASNATLTKDAGFTGKIETSADGSSWTEYTTLPGKPDAKYVRAGY